MEKGGIKTTIEKILEFNDPIDFPKLFTDEELNILRNNSVSYLRENYLNLYSRYYKYNPDSKIFTTTKWTENNVLEGILKYKSINEMLNEDWGLYNVIHKKFRQFLPLYGKELKKKVLCVELNQEFESISETSKVLGIPKQAIGRVCREERVRTHNKTFKFI
jgi:hypothetical protein